jgi:putative transposase
MDREDLEGIEKKALDQLKSGKSLFGKDGAFAPLLKGFIEKALEAEMEDHLDEGERIQGNKRNGKGKKTIKSAAGSFVIETPQDRHSNFEPELIKKRQTILADSLEEKIIGLYGLGMSYRDISRHILEIYDTEISHTVLSQITDRIIPEVKAWQNRPLDSVYPIIWLDAMHFKVKQEGRVANKALYNILGITKDGFKEILGIYLSESEGANFWLQVLTDLNNRGVKDILIASIDNLSGFSEAIESIFPKSEIQSCVVHQLRNTRKYVTPKDRKAFMLDMKNAYQANTKDNAELELEKLSEKWKSKYPLVIKSWKRNWEKLSTYFAYTAPIRKLIYTTNPIEGYHRQIRKVTKTKGAFPNETALLKLVYLVTKNVENKWTTPITDWGLIVQQLAIRFEGRIELDL